MKKILNTTVTPPGGWVYIEPTTGVRFEDLNYQAIIIRARRHREAVGLPVHGQWMEEVDQVMIELNPLIPHQELGVDVRTFHADDIMRFWETMTELRGNELVEEAEQIRRADICAACPKNGVVNCKYCGWLAKQITGLMGGRKIPRIDRIFKHSCLACGCDLTAKTAVPLDILKRVDEKMGESPDYDPKCWMRE